MENFDLHKYLRNNPLLTEAKKGRKKLLENEQFVPTLPKVLITFVIDAYNSDYACIWTAYDSLEEAKKWIQDLIDEYTQANYDPENPDYFEELEGIYKGANFIPDYPGESLSGGFNEETTFDMYLVKTPEQLELLAKEYGEEIKDQQEKITPGAEAFLPQGLKKLLKKVF